MVQRTLLPRTCRPVRLGLGSSKAMNDCLKYQGCRHHQRGKIQQVVGDIRRRYREKLRQVMVISVSFSVGR